MSTAAPDGVDTSAPAAPNGADLSEPETGGEAGTNGSGANSGDEAAEAQGAGPAAGSTLDDAAVQDAVMALLFASPEPLALQRLAQLLDDAPAERIQAALAALVDRLRQSALPFELRELAGGWRVLTSSAQAPFVARLAKVRKAERISAAALETLAIVAYRQPATKAEIEAIRGVQAGPVLRSLVDRGLLRISGKADQPGSALQYATSKAFLDQFGLAGLHELPRDAELAKE